MEITSSLQSLPPSHDDNNKNNKNVKNNGNYLKSTVSPTKPASLLFSSLPPPAYSPPKVVPTKPVNISISTVPISIIGIIGILSIISILSSSTIIIIIMMMTKPSQPPSLLQGPELPCDPVPDSCLAPALNLIHKSLSLMLMLMLILMMASNSCPLTFSTQIKI